MRKYAAVCQSRSHAEILLQSLGAQPQDIKFAVESETLERTLKRNGSDVVRGSLRDRALYRELLPAEVLVVSIRDKRRLRGVLEGIRRERGETPVLVLCFQPIADLPVDPEDHPWAHFVPVGDRFSTTLRADIRFAGAKTWVRKLREILDDAGRVLILLQDDPDPDGLACGLALRSLLGRKRSTMPMGSFGNVTRPENLEMIRILDLDLIKVADEDLGNYDAIVMVDTQPPHLRHKLPRVDAVIDHHPTQSTYEARFRDVRPAYGATATILVEYLRAERIKINERLATALLYAIRTDTLLLDRPVSHADVEAFSWLFARANINQVRRIERPALPLETLELFAEGLKKARMEDKVVFSHLGEVSREDIVPQLADFCLQVEGMDWSAVSGVCGNELVMSVRNVGFVQKAGSVVKAAFGSLGSAGGHRSMAKAVIPLENLPLDEHAKACDKTYRFIEDRFLAALRGEE